MPYMAIHCSIPKWYKTVYIQPQIVDIRTMSLFFVYTYISMFTHSLLMRDTREATLIHSGVESGIYEHAQDRMDITDHYQVS